ncbi:MAG: Gfo/Idh/MocA family oxidoreductase [Phycisphaeraceae bacterium]|nr:Gfo/Idh/MocA family oxidoreductase [Phycisphaeraceae bacterium]
MKISRRSFLTSASATAASVPFIIPSRVWGAQAKPSDRLTMGFIGVGKQHRGLLRNFLHRDTRVLAVCDVDTTRRDTAQKTVNDFYKSRGGGTAAGCAAYNDYRKIIARKDIDAVCIATPDHWHTQITVEALKSGKDVYCEKPLTHNIHESIVVMDTVKATGRILQTGSMQRSSSEFRIACELVQNGAIGKLIKVECQFGDPGRPCDLPEETMEPGLDWNMWQGPAPVRAYNSVLSPRGNHDHFPNWRSYSEYGGGMVTDWGAHHLDIAQWGMGMDNSGPVEVRPAPEGTRAKRGVTLVYANGVTVTHKDGFGIHFYGTEGEVQVNRGKFSFTRDGELISKFTKREDGGSLRLATRKAEKEFLANAKIKLYKSENHQDDFLACVKSRKKPITSEIVGARSAICCHLMNQAYYHGEVMKWNPAKNEFIGGTGNPAWLTRDYRSPWNV